MPPANPASPLRDAIRRAMKSEKDPAIRKWAAKLLAGDESANQPDEPVPVPVGVAIDDALARIESRVKSTGTGVRA